MQQYYSIKAIHHDAILLFRVGDFYETFGTDAIKASGILGITLTRRANGTASFVELAGFPHHSIDTYLPKLVRAGERVAICEQLEDPKSTKKIIKRGVVELVTPGITTGENNLTTKENNFLASVFFGKKNTGISFLDISTGEFYVAEGDDQYIDKLISSLQPKEILNQRGLEDRFNSTFGDKHYTYRLDDWVFSEDINRDKLCKQFECKSLNGFGISNMNSAIAAAGAILYYLEFTEHKNIKHISSISRIDKDEYVWLDKFSIRNLELFSSNNSIGKSGFTDIIDRTISPMGGRLLRRWVALPIKDIDKINRRLDVVAEFKDNIELRESIINSLEQIGDLERIVSRIASFKVMPRELIQLKSSLYAIEKLLDNIKDSSCTTLRSVGSKIDLCLDIRSKIESNLFPDPSNQLLKGGVIADGVDLELDDLRRIANHGKDVMQDIQTRESEATGIPSLKINYNNVYGYYIEVRNTHKDKVPEGWIRKQTLTNAERYITAELKEYEEKILGAEGRIVAIEQRLYSELIVYISNELQPLQQNANIVAHIDCLHSFAHISNERNYSRPVLNEGKAIDIKGGRHPVIETLLKVGEEYVPNDIYLDNDTQQIMMITGPNMSGKSALLRQTALIVLMAQIGCYVPATSAEIGIIDKIFTRVGASDNISQGESTFMVEMLESASIMNNISDRSLVLFDEIGRGTSTYDGISIAWAMVEHLHNYKYRAKTLFATHYHELNEMEDSCPRVKNYNVSVKEVDKSIIFLRKLARGGTGHSFGIHVAKMAGMPKGVIVRAEDILKMLESFRQNSDDAHIYSKKATVAELRPIQTNNNNIQLSMFQLDDPVLTQIRDEIKGLDINTLTPIEALNKLNEIKKITGL